MPPTQGYNPIQALQDAFTNDPFGYNLALQRQGDQASFGTPSFLGGAGGLIGHQMQTVFDSADMLGDAQGKNVRYNPRQLPGNPPIRGLEHAHRLL
jgi:hypothetical protein